MLRYKTIITYRPNEFVTWYITESGFIMTSGRTQTVEAARIEASNYITEKARQAERAGHNKIKSTVEVIDLT